MDIEFIQVEHRNDVVTLTEVCGISLEEAYQLYHKYDRNVQSAIKFKLGLVSPSNQRRHSQSYPEQQHINEINDSFDDEADQPLQKYQHFIQNGKPFFKKYPLKAKVNQIGKQIMNPEENINLRTNLQKKTISKVQLKIFMGGVEAGVIWSWKQSFPIGIIIINYEDQSIKDLCEIVCNQHIAKKMNTFFKIYAIDVNQQTIPKWFNNFIDHTKDSNCLAIFRVNYVDQIEVIAKIKFGQLEDFNKKITHAKSQSIQRQLDEKHVVKQHLFMSQGKSYVRPKPIKEKLKIREDYRLRKQQDQEFHKVFKSVNQIQQIKQQKISSLSPQELKKQRTIKRQKMQIYTDGFNLKIRVPCGKSLILKVNPQECIQYLFDYIDSEGDDIGFQHDSNRIFDIMYGDKKDQSLSLKRKELIRDVFEQFELLVVKETS